MTSRVSVKYANTYEHLDIKDSYDLLAWIDRARRVVLTNIYEHLLQTDSKLQSNSASQNSSTNTSSSPTHIYERLSNIHENLRTPEQMKETRVFTNFPSKRYATFLETISIGISRHFNCTFAPVIIYEHLPNSLENLRTPVIWKDFSWKHGATALYVATI